MRVRFLLPTIGIVALLTLLATTTVVSPAHSVDDVPGALHGQAPGSLVDVQVTVFPQTGNKTGEFADELYLEGARVQLSERDWAVAVDPDSIPARYIHETGVVDFTVYLIGESATWMSNKSARAVIDTATGEEYWVDAAESAPYIIESTSTLARASAAVRPAQLSHRQITSLIGNRSANDAGRETETEDDGVTVTEEAPVDPEMSPGGGGYCGTQPTDTYVLRSTTIGTSYPLGDSTAYMIVNGSEGASYGIAVGSGPGGSFQASGSRFVQTGWSFTWNANQAARSYRKAIEYRKWQSWCGSGPIVPSWRPHAESGGTAQNFDVTRPDWWKCQNVSPGTWVRDNTSGEAYSYGGAVKFEPIIGIDLSIKREWSTSNKLVYKVAGAKRLCGNGDDWPALAGKIMERNR